MSGKPDIRNYVNPQPDGGRFSAQWQLDYLPDGVSYTEDKTGKVVDRLIRSVREGTIIRVRRLFCLAPWYGSPRKRRSILADRVDAIKENGGSILEAETQRRTDIRGHLARMVMGASDDIATAGRSVSKGKTGRPPKEWTPAQRLVMESLWHSRAYKNDNERVAAIEGKLSKSPSRSSLRNMFGKPGDPPKEVLAVEVEQAKRTKRSAKVYFIQNGDAVKIGISVTPRKRMADIAVSNHADLRLLGVLPGGAKRERALHAKFKAHHIRGEWFKLVPEIKEYLRQYRRKSR